MSKTNLVNSLIKDVKERLTLDGKNRVFNEGEKLRPDFMKEPAEAEAFTREFVIDKIFTALDLEKLPEKSFDTPGSHRSVDYLIKSDRGKFLVEAKPLNADLIKGKDSGVNQIQGLFRLVEVKENYNFGVATNGLHWVFIDKNGEIVSNLQLETQFDQIKDFLAGKEKVVSPKTEEEISKKFYGWYNALLHGGRYKDHENKTRTISEADCLVNNVIGVKDLEEREQIAQVVTNRLIFIKFLQSKGIIGEDILSFLTKAEEYELMPKLRQLFFSVLNTPNDQREDIIEQFKDVPYLNGSLFTHIEVEKKHVDYKIKAEILREIIRFLDSFRFVHKEQLDNVYSIDPEILGYIFERAMTATDRKGTGAYYTPKFVTKYISEHTIYPFILDRANEILRTEKGYRETELLKDLEELFILPATTLKELWNKVILKIKVLDNACGSGAFLLAAANILFELNRRIDDKLQLGNSDIALKKLILINNLYGVDINPNGIEIAKLRLWLWLVDSYEPNKVEALPNIDYNLCVGNSLIGYMDVSEFRGSELTLTAWLLDEEKTTLETLLLERNDLIQEYKRAEGDEAKELSESINRYDERISTLLNANLHRQFRERNIPITREEFLRLNPFHWGFEFYEVFDLEKPKEKRGFDVVIGNPPYVRQESLGELKRHFKDQYTVYHGVADLYVYFIERSLSSLNDNGIFSYIVANKWMRANYGTPLRKWLKRQCIEELIDFGDLPVFQATTYPCIIRISKNTPKPTFAKTEVKTLNFTSLDEYVNKHEFAVNRTGLDDSGWSLVDEKTQALLKKIRLKGVPLGDYVNGRIYYGIKTGLNEAFVIDAATRDKLIQEDPRSEELIKPFLVGRDIKRYQPPKSERYLIFTRRGVDIDRYPALKRHLLQFKERLMPKPKDWKGEKWPGRKPGDYKWYEIQDTVDYYIEFEKPKIIYPNICKKPEFVLDENNWYTNQKCFIIAKPDKYLLGILNSYLTYFLFKSILPKLRGDFYEPSYVIFKDFPIRTIDFSVPADKSLHEKLVTLVEHMLRLHEQLSKARTEPDKAALQQQIEETDRQIDKLVYKLYDLTSDEIAVIEESCLR
ncbi:MAG TPA: restriction endonuclease subunit R [Methanomicrobia archaeon]|nr:restriction endonuclease subunit R [Methanomicrobia archaeon]